MTPSRSSTQFKTWQASDVPRFEPFNGLRYNAESGSVDDVIAPPYDVIGHDERARLEARSPYNAVRIELPRDDEAGGRSRYAVAADLLRQWQGDKVLVADDPPAFYVHRMGYHDPAGRPRQTVGVIGALGIEAPGHGDVLPHEHTTPKDRADRLEMLRQVRANTSPIWGLSLASGLSELCQLPGPPVARATDDDGVHHRLYLVSEAGLCEAIASVVGSAPIVVADGHHRYDVADVYRREPGAAPGADAIMMLVVELTEEQLTVRATHRLLSGLPDGFDVVAALDEWFEVVGAGPRSGVATLPDRMDDAGALGLVTDGGAWLLRPRPATRAAAESDLDSAVLAVAAGGLPDGLEVRFQNGVAEATAAVVSGDAQAAVLLRPATVAQIAASGHERKRMPPKTTYFWPKPRTGLVFRLLD
jgi:uncharacterized protein (DUF1015 family)